MNLKLKRLVRTPSSEQYALFDLEQVDIDDLPMTIGKLDLHYTGEGVYGTILLWDDASRRLTSTQRSAFIRALLGEVREWIPYYRWIPDLRERVDAIIGKKTP